MAVPSTGYTDGRYSIDVLRSWLVEPGHALGPFGYPIPFGHVVTDIASNSTDRREVVEQIGRGVVGPR